MIRRIKVCSSCQKRFSTASGASLCLTCRKPASSNSVSNEPSSSGPIHDDEGVRVKISTEISSTIAHDTLLQTNNALSEAAVVSIRNNGDTNLKDLQMACQELSTKRSGGNDLPNNQLSNKRPRVSVDSDCVVHSTSSESPIEQPTCRMPFAAPNEEESHVHRVLLGRPNNNECGEEFSTLTAAPSCKDDSLVGHSVGEEGSGFYEKDNNNNEFVHDGNHDENRGDEKHLDPSNESYYPQKNELSNQIEDNHLKQTGVCNNQVSTDDDSDIECWDASEKETCSSDDNPSDEQFTTIPKHLSNHSTLDDFTPQAATDCSKDLCYICGSDLSKLTTGIRGRVAHMKRCSAKYGKLTLGKDDEDLPAEEELPDINDNTHSDSSNPNLKDRWHGDATLELEANASFNTESTNKIASKQTAIDKFFKAPVRSLTNVLMAGSKRLAKSQSKDKTKNEKNGVKPKGKWGGGGGWRSQNRGSCPGYKKIPGTDFICDGFHYASQTLSNNYFLTHFHSDHYGGITKQWKEGTIYCSAPTANLVHQQLGVEKKYLHPLPMNTPVVVQSKGKPIKVTLLDANHCPGAIMFLFEVGKRQILHVGDFRWNNSIMMRMPQLRSFSDMNPRLDEIFLDTTYCDAKYTLPTQDAAIAAAIKVVKDELSTAEMMGTKSLLLFGSYTIGKEKIYLSVAEYLKTKVYVDKRRYRILSALEWPKERMDLFTTVKSESYLWVVPLGHVNFKKMPEYLDDGNKNKPVFAKPYGRVVGFRPTGWTYSASNKSNKSAASSPSKQKLISTKTSGRFSVHGVPYSEHSSFPELVDCLRCLKPKKITTTVSVSKSEEQIRMLLDAVNNMSDE